jgi:hypothetical protein
MVAEIVETLSIYKIEEFGLKFGRLLDLGLCVQVLGETLELGLHKVLSESADGRFPATSRIWKTKQIIPFQVTNWKLWCLSERQMIQSNFDTTTLHFTSTLGRETQTLDHSSCNYNHCFARQLDEGNYQRRHVFEGCKCLDLQPDILSIIATLEAGEIPCIQISRPGSDLQNVEISVVSSGPFVAISHVWADGLGNSSANSMYSCQLLRLGNIVRQLSIDDNPCNQRSDTVIWIDALCIPVEPKFQWYRKASLSSLHRIYSTAHRVLVLDYALMNTLITSSLEEKLVRICISGWMRRLWTLQESVLGRTRIRFVFRDGIFRLPDNINARYHTIGVNAMRYIDQYLPPLIDHPVTRLFTHEQHDLSRTTISFGNLFASLMYRSTSKVEDEAICFASLLNLETNAFKRAETPAIQMRTFIDMLQEKGVKVPERFIFTGEDKIHFAGYRWVPSSFMSMRTVDVEFLLEDYANNRLVKFDEKGIYVRTAGFSIEFGSEDTVIDSHIKFCALDSVEVYTVWPQTRSGTSAPSRLWEEKICGSVPSNAAVLLSTEDRSQPSIRGVLVSKYLVECNLELSPVHFTSLLCPIHIWVSGNISDHTNSDLKAVGHVHDQNQLWCIG